MAIVGIQCCGGVGLRKILPPETTANHAYSPIFRRAWTGVRQVSTPSASASACTYAEPCAPLSFTDYRTAGPLRTHPLGAPFLRPLISLLLMRLILSLIMIPP